MPILLLISFLLASCSDNLKYNETEPRMTIEILNVSDTILVGNSVYFQAKINPKNNAYDYYWTINKEKARRLDYTYLFDENGVYEVEFYALDHLGDTLNTGITISVSSPPICDSLSVNIFQGSPIFKWECYDADGGQLTYNFSLKGKDRTILTATLQENFLQLGDTLPSDYWKINVTANNNYNFTTQLDSTWQLDSTESFVQ